MTDDASDDPFLKTFIDMMRVEMPDKVITNFVFVAEVVSSQNNELSIVTSNGMTPWLAQGMLKAAEEMILTGSDSFIDDEDDQ
jgi:hypothetical protein